ncbi:MAG: DUF5666 domain-containing protein [Omnitrophica WOR_2 bacterium]
MEVLEGDEKWSFIKNDQVILAGQRIRTRTLSNARLTFSDGSQVSVGPDTEISLDDLDAQSGGNPRVIVLTQWSGETGHEVVPSNVEGSRYEVHTPTATGTAKGTRFHVTVSNSQGSHYSVDEGTVAVTGTNLTVLVNAGEATTIQENEAPSTPAVHISSEGVVSQTGDVWMIAGQPFVTGPESIVMGNPQIGDLVMVEGRLLEDGTRLADLILLLHYSPANQFTLTGQVESIGDSEWKIAGQTVMISTTTNIDSSIVVNDLARAEGIILQSGILQATRIQKLEEMPFEFTGIIQTIGDQTWVISEKEVIVTSDTWIDNGLVKGDRVHVQGIILQDGKWQANRIEKDQYEERKFEFTGKVESMDPWQVAGIPIEVRSWTEISVGLEVNDVVRIEGQIQEDGIWIADEIEKIEENTSPHIVLVGSVISMDPWVISGIPITVTGQTVIDSNIIIGSLVRVDILLLPDGSWQVAQIQLLQGYIWFPGCMNVTATIVSIQNNQIQFAGWPVLTKDDSIQVVGNLTPNSLVQFQVCFTENTTIHIVYIIVIQPADGNVDPENMQKTAVCHKPDKKKGGHTLMLPGPAIPAHLGHGDRLGLCAP